MKRISALVALIIAVSFFSQHAIAQGKQKSEIEKIILSYQEALNASDASRVVDLYTTDGILLPNAAPSAIGSEQVKATYQYVFDNFKYSLQFTIGEVVVNGNYAFATSTSKGSFVVKSNGETIPDENRELFVFHRVNGEWKIARYMYNKAK
jgi:uncharacterized protein (TIGR02246 family)